jgi:hypothetical protein
MGPAVSEFEQAREAFRRRRGFDPASVIEGAFRRGEFDLEGGTEDERAFIREVLTGGGAAKPGEQSTDENAPIGLQCPGCGEPPRMALPGGNQAFCGTDGCRILLWDPTQTRAEMAADGIHEIDLSSWREGEGGR